MSDNVVLYFVTNRDVRVAGQITITEVLEASQYNCVMCLVFAAYYDIMIFSKICFIGQSDETMSIKQ